jgi:hypothetical protein
VIVSSWCGASNKQLCNTDRWEMQVVAESSNFYWHHCSMEASKKLQLHMHRLLQHHGCFPGGLGKHDCNTQAHSRWTSAH